MSNTNWIVVFKLNEFISCFNDKELIQLSMSCKKLRACLTPTIFKTYNFCSFIDTRNYKGYDIAEDDEDYERDEDEDDIIYIRNPYKQLTRKFIENKVQFNQDLKLYPCKPKLFSVCYLKDYSYLLYDISDAFSTLSGVILTKLYCKIETIQYLLDNLKYLSNFELSSNYIFQYSQNNTQIPINWPISLKKLKIGSNMVAYVEDKESSILTKRDAILDLHVQLLSLTPKYLPKLKHFDYVFSIQQDEIDGFSSFIELNPQLENLKIVGFSVHPQLFRTIKFIDKLTCLSLNFTVYKLSESDFTSLPDLSTVACLIIHLDYNSIEVHKLIDKFPNLKELTVEMYDEIFEELYVLSKNYPKIKTLNVKIHLKYFASKMIILPKLENLTSLEIILNRSNYFNHTDWNADSCPNLNVVKFSLDKSQAPFKLEKLFRKLDRGWKQVFSPYKISLYKINQ
ncbi:hypothetical protein CONCODRAFT_79990 [Conidiobolus coronatus NRRL 28638]|uniref:F-box domain-containing protein n=1 Tax=Conidiobolus coronatus (strain ATCC 28846 / CBS 209.66 / NRRL 28638) TaxID=796925 RepID=A0A137NY74_CONC2|nr:hypothetical protein CONCODRAFT_79990 [Conidiobolus coronatus NRRL 28638]|eukprot:KXN67823.1 hypothetical protein CONCODRAFT_79990 [Conidiobolus coronatus NRRL 28638]